MIVQCIFIYISSGRKETLVTHLSPPAYDVTVILCCINVFTGQKRHMKTKKKSTCIQKFREINNFNIYNSKTLTE